MHYGAARIRSLSHSRTIESAFARCHWRHQTFLCLGLGRREKVSFFAFLGAAFFPSFALCFSPGWAAHPVPSGALLDEVHGIKGFWANSAMEGLRLFIFTCRYADILSVFVYHRNGIALINFICHPRFGFCLVFSGEFYRFF